MIGSLAARHRPARARGDVGLISQVLPRGGLARGASSDSGGLVTFAILLVASPLHCPPPYLHHIKLYLSLSARE